MCPHPHSPRSRGLPERRRTLPRRPGRGGAPRGGDARLRGLGLPWQLRLGCHRRRLLAPPDPSAMPVRWPTPGCHGDVPFSSYPVNDEVCARCGSNEEDSTYSLPPTLIPLNMRSYYSKLQQLWERTFYNNLSLLIHSWCPRSPSHPRAMLRILNINPSRKLELM